MNYAHSYAAIVKQEKQDDGTLLVYGKATDDSLDIDQQICDAAWLDRAMPEWFKSGGNIREQHSSIAAGVAKEYESKKDGHYIQALVVDPVSVKKVESGVLKGFSIGIKTPRVVRDQKAVNGRIIDGIIVEVSLVDRPANPNAKLMLAKSVNNDLVQVEEFETKIPTPADVFGTKSVSQETQKGSKMKQIKQITELAKSLTPETVKFDKTLFDTAVKAIADLIVVEAGEISAENSERDSIESLLDALKHLRNWYEGEVEEGEAMPEMESIEMGSEPETVKGDGCECECDSCKADKGCDSKMCKCMSAHADAEKSVSKCLECGCDKPGEDHGRSDVTTAEMIAPSVSDETEKSVIAENVVTDIIEKAVKSAKESVTEEIEILKTAIAVAEKESQVLKDELATAKSLAAHGGPKRTAVSASQVNDNLLRAANYATKAAAATDPVLAKGYKALAEEFYAKSEPSTDSE